MRKFTAILMTVLMIAGLFVSCNNNAPVVDETVSVSFDEAVSRNLTASLDNFNAENYYWAYKAEKKDNTGLNSGAKVFAWMKTGAKGLSGVTIPGFSQGTWAFTLYAYTEEGKNNAEYSTIGLAYTGTNSNVTLVKGGGNVVSVTVSPITTGNGTLFVDISKIKIKNASGTVIDNQNDYSKVVTVEPILSTIANPTQKEESTNYTYEAAPGAYKVTVGIMQNGITFASGSVVATVYSNLTTTVAGDLVEMVTDASFDPSINPDIMNRVASSDSVDYSTIRDTEPIKLSESDTSGAKVEASVPKEAVEAAITHVTGKESATNEQVSMSVSVNTTSATSNSIALEISMSATVKYTDDSGKEVVKTEPVSNFGSGNTITVEVELQKNLQNVKVTHNGDPMSVISESNSEGYSYNAETGILTIKTSSFSPFGITYDEPVYVAKIGNVSYTTLQGAVDAAGIGDTIILQDDVVLSKSLVISGGKELTIDLNGFDISAPSGVIKIVHANVTLTGTGTIYESKNDQFGAVLLYGAATDKGANYSVVSVDENVTLRGWSGIFVSIDEGGKDSYNNYGIVANVKGKIVLPGMDTHTTRDGAGIYINGSNKNTEGNVPVFNLDGAEITGNSGIYAAGYAKWNLKDVTINAESEALSIKAGEFVIDGGTYNAEGTFHDPSIDSSNGSVSTGAALSMTSNEGYAHKVDVTVKDGKFISLNGYAVFEGIPYDEKEPSKLVAPKSYVTLKINGGEFIGNAEKEAIKLSKIEQPKVITGGSFNTNPERYVLSYCKIDNDGTKYVVSVDDSKVAMVGDTYYSTLEDAISNATDGQTVYLLKNISVGKTIEINKSIVLDGNNNELSSSSYLYQLPLIKVTGTDKEVTIKNIKIREKSSACSIWYGVMTSAKGGKLTVENLDIDVTERALFISECTGSEIIVDDCSLVSMYPFNVSGGSIKNMTVSNSTLNGWTSFTLANNNAPYVFNNCNFGSGHGYNTLKPYGDTTLNNCHFTKDYFESLEGGIATGTNTPITLGFNNCTVAGQDLTAELLHSMFNYDITSGSSEGNSTIDNQYWFINNEKISIASN